MLWVLLSVVTDTYSLFLLSSVKLSRKPNKSVGIYMHQYTFTTNQIHMHQN